MTTRSTGSVVEYVLQTVRSAPQKEIAWWDGTESIGGTDEMGLRKVDQNVNVAIQSTFQIVSMSRMTSGSVKGYRLKGTFYSGSSTRTRTYYLSILSYLYGYVPLNPNPKLHRPET